MINRKTPNNIVQYMYVTKKLESIYKNIMELHKIVEAFDQIK
jgi:hypothetical protein